MPRAQYKRPVEQGVIRDLEHNGYEILTRGMPFCFARKKEGGELLSIFVRHRKRRQTEDPKRDGFAKNSRKLQAWIEEAGLRVIRIGG